MLEKTMKQILTKKITKWKESIDDQEVRFAIDKDLVITGGCFTSMMMNEEPKDFDCYFRTKESVLKVAEYYVNKWNKDNRHRDKQVFLLDGANPSAEILSFYDISEIDESSSGMFMNCPPERVKIIYPSEGVVGNPEAANASEELGSLSVTEQIEEIDEIKADEIIDKENKEYFPVFMSSNAITLSDGIQIIVRFYGEPEEIHDTFDFVHTKAYFKTQDRKIVIPREVYEHTINKVLKYTGSRYPVCSIFRVRKFISRGWTINAGQLLKMSMQISELNLSDVEVLEDQLVGVDSLYFMNLIHQFKMKQQNDPNFVLTSNYILTLIDKIF